MAKNPVVVSLFLFVWC